MDGASKPRPIIVLGVERSGTSVVAEMVSRWGAYSGERENLTAPDKHNPQGYWEYKPIWDFLVELGNLEAGVSWWDASFQRRVMEKLSVPQYRAKAFEMVAAMEKAGKPWIWKDPALSFFLPFWKEIWGNAAYIITVRNPYDSARSWQKFVIPSKPEGSVDLISGNILRWQYMMLLILKHTEETEDKIFVPYEELVLKPFKHAQRLYDFLNRSCAVPVLDETKIKAMAQTVNAELWRNRSAKSFAQVHEATDAQNTLYRFILGKVTDPLTKFDIAKHPMSVGWRELIKNQEAVVRSLRVDK